MTHRAATRSVARRRDDRRRRTAARALLAFTALFAIALAACGDDGDVRVVAITRTPGPTVTVEPTSVTPQPPTASTATPAPTASVGVPRPPDSLLAGANLLVPYLEGGGANLELCLPAVVEEWGFSEVEGPRCVLADLDGDGDDELAFLVTLQPTDDLPPPGDVWFFDGGDNGHRLLGSARSYTNRRLDGVRIAAAADLTGDGLPEIVISSRTCGASSCSTEVSIVSAHRGALEDLAPPDLGVANSEPLRVEDLTGDGLADVVLRGGLVTSAGAGPQRAFERVASWAGLKFFVNDRPDPPRYLFHAIVDADALFASADYAAARDLYLRAADDRSLVDWKVEIGQPAGATELVPYALFRAALAAGRLGDGALELSLLARAFNEYRASLHGPAAAAYMARRNEGASPAEACRLVESFLLTQRAAFERIWDYGYANPQHSITDICR